MSAEQLDVVVTPTSPSATVALSRFEFEAGKGNEGTKVLMVEWETTAFPIWMDSDETNEKKEDTNIGQQGDWEVSWEGKTTVLPVAAADTATDVDAEASTDTAGQEGSGALRRVYFLLPPGAPIPPLISISKRGTGHDNDAAAAAAPIIKTKPLPAIFPAELTGGEAAAGVASCRRGVLHTLWAKKRLAELQAEIASEMKKNSESVGLEMAMQERQWIVDHFGVGPTDDDVLPVTTKLHDPQPGPTTGPVNSRNPVGGRLGEKLKGLRLATSQAELDAASVARLGAPSHLLSPSPDASDVAISSFSSFMPKQGEAKYGSRNSHGNSGSSSNSNVASLNAIIGGGVPSARGREENTTEEDLFALPMSPRSPEMKKSPFSMI